MLTSSPLKSTVNPPVSIRVLLLPKFEKGSFDTSAVGEGQLFYDHYFCSAETYPLPSFAGGGKLYVSGSIAMCLTGIGKLQSSNTLTALLLDPRFDFSKCIIMSIGCAGGNIDTTVLGDVVLASSTVDYDLGHHADIRDMDSYHASTEKNPSFQAVTWFREPAYDSFGSFRMDEHLIGICMEHTKGLELQSTTEAIHSMIHSYGRKPDLLRMPRVVRGTIFSSDNYWKGRFDSANADFMVKSYVCPDPFCASEMEDHALALVCQRFGILDHFLALRGIVNFTCFQDGVSPELLWSDHSNAIMDYGLESESEAIFEQAMKNLFLVCSSLIRFFLSTE